MRGSGEARASGGCQIKLASVPYCLVMYEEVFYVFLALMISRGVRNPEDSIMYAWFKYKLNLEILHVSSDGVQSSHCDPCKLKQCQSCFSKAIFVKILCRKISIY